MSLRSASAFVAMVFVSAFFATAPAAPAAPAVSQLATAASITTTAPGTRAPLSRAPVHVEGPHVRADGDDWVVTWAAGTHTRQDRMPIAARTEIPAWRGATAVPAALLEPVEPPAAIMAAPDRILAMGDIHGRFASFLSVLRAVGVIDEDGSWAFGTDHLVCCGDLMNRDHDVVALLWFLRRLEVEAADAGGAVHVILGNHEQLALQGDERYVHARQLEASERLGTRYADLYARGTVLGDWLRTKPSIVRLGDLAFVHGGFSEPMLRLVTERGFDIDDVNVLVRERLGVSRAERDADPVLSLLFGYAGPLWHRGYFFGDAPYHPISSEDLDRVLAWLEARAIVVGHTQFDRVGTHLEGRVIATDVDLDETPEAVLVRGDEVLRVTAGGVVEPIVPLELGRR